MIRFKFFIFFCFIILNLASLSYSQNETDNVHNLLSESIKMIDNRMYSDAERSINSIIELSPDFKPAIYYRALSRMHLKKIDLAEKDFLSVLNSGESFPDLFFYLGLVSEMQEKNTDAINYYSKALTLDPINSRYHNNRGMIYAKNGEFNLAFEDVNKAIAIDPQYARAYFNRALYFYYIKKDKKLAINDMKKSKNFYSLQKRLAESNLAQEALSKWMD
ncbi:MAG: tetratricopeptide repeat protein [Thermodesulfobacteriota bacteirum]|nr:tetratricopeptide repeat protein [Thermodesulfobacteriota bacterium]